MFKKKSPGKSKSPAKTRNDSVNDDEADQQSENEYHEEEENQTYFTPVIALPDKIEVKTGEEDEELLYSHRAKLFRYTEGEWKERGLGDVKVLKHRVSGKLRVLMRREQIFKLCLNHILTADIEYKKKDDKSWMFVANDFSEGEIEVISFCIRFKSQEIAEEFKSIVDLALKGEECEDTDGNNSGNLELIKKLQLPAGFYDNQKTENNCSGCRGCKSEDFIFPTHKVTENIFDENCLPLKIGKIKIKPVNKPAQDKKSVSFSLYDNKENEKVKELFSGAGNVKLIRKKVAFSVLELKSLKAVLIFLVALEEIIALVVQQLEVSLETPVQVSLELKILILTQAAQYFPHHLIQHLHQLQLHNHQHQLKQQYILQRHCLEAWSINYQQLKVIVVEFLEVKAHFLLLIILVEVSLVVIKRIVEILSHHSTPHPTLNLSLAVQHLEVPVHLEKHLHLEIHQHLVFRPLTHQLNRNKLEIFLGLQLEVIHLVLQMPLKI